MSKDIRFLLLLGAGVVAAAWAVTYYGPIAQLVGTGTNGYITMVRGLEPPALQGGAGGAGAIAPNTTLGAGGVPQSVAAGGF